MSEHASSGGSGFATLLLILFIGLKLTGYITWSWVWVLSPFWIPLAIVMFFIVMWLLLKVVYGK